MIQGRNTAKGTITPANLNADGFHKYLFDKFNGPAAVVAAAGAGAASGTAAALNVMTSAEGYVYTHSPKGTQTILGPSYGASGLSIAQDLTDNDGAEYVPGSHLGTGKYAFTVGTSKDFFVRGKFTIADVSGTDDFALGFRKAEAMQANLDDYDEMVCLNVISGDIKRESILNNGATVTVDSGSNWADGETHTLEIQIVSRKARFFIDGVDVTASCGAAFTFDSGEVVVPFFFFLHATTSPGDIIWKELEVGLIEHKRV